MLLIVQINGTQHDWNLSAVIEGEAYFGPPTMVAKSATTTLYPLIFKPLYQGEIEVFILNLFIKEK